MRALYRPVVLNEPILTTGYVSLEQFGKIGTRFCLPSGPTCDAVPPSSVATEPFNLNYSYSANAWTGNYQCLYGQSPSDPSTLAE